MADGALNVDNFYEDDEGERKYDPELEAKIKAALENFESFDVEADEEEGEEDGEQESGNFFYEPASQISSYFLFPESVDTNGILFISFF